MAIERSPRLSVVTPLFNCLDLTKAMVASLKATMPGWMSYEVILVDDGSTDGTRDWLATLAAPFRVILNERNLGFGASTNRGAAVAKGRILAFLNNDLLLTPGWLGPMVRALGGLGNNAGVVGNVQLNATTLEVDHTGIVVDLKGKPIHDRELPHALSRFFMPVRRVFAATGACMLIRADTWRSLGGFDEAYVNGCEDLDLCFRARQAGLTNVVALESRVLHHVSSSPGRKLKDEENSRRLFLRWRETLAKFGSRRWARLMFAWHLHEPRNYPEKLEAIWTASYLARLHGVPPQRAFFASLRKIDEELAHWQEMFSD
ncbi:MAG TPA: glycosyltransferase family 2 protein [Opitutaceae bacterium]|jgi:GT2 family glycosyltransferase|nr:glycosyltransferase family 2 protein [Opitutaceae bacterium]